MRWYVWFKRCERGDEVLVCDGVFVLNVCKGGMKCECEMVCWV